jgi:hypothetical protein
MVGGMGVSQSRWWSYIHARDLSVTSSLKTTGSSRSRTTRPTGPGVLLLLERAPWETMRSTRARRSPS